MQNYGPLPKDRNEPADLQLVYGRFTGGQDEGSSREVIVPFGDCIAALVICAEHHRMALSFQENDLLWFAIAPLRTGQTCAHSIKTLLSRTFPRVTFKEPARVIQRRRFRVQNEYVNLTLYKAELGNQNQTAETCDCSSPSNSTITWKLYDEIKTMADSLVGPEPIFLAKLLLENNQNYDLLVEYSLKPVQSWYLVSSASEMVRKCAGLEHVPFESFVLLYEDYVKHCFPSIYMTLNKFTSYIAGLPLYVEFNEQFIFNAFDVDKRRYIDFYQLVTGLALMDPNPETLKQFGDIRLEYIHRLYNRQLATADSREDDISGDDFATMENDRTMVQLFYDELQVIGPYPFDFSRYAEIRPELIDNQNFEPANESQVHSSMSFEALTEYAKQNPGFDLLFRSGVRSIRQIISSLSSNKVSDQHVAFKLDPQYIKISSNSGVQVDSEFIPYQIESVSQQPNVFWRKSSTSTQPTESVFDQLPSSEEHDKVYEFLLELVRYLVFTHHLFTEWSFDVSIRLKTVPYILRLCEDVKRIFSRERRILRISSPCYVFGDIHGSSHDLNYYDAILWRMGPGSLTDNFLLLGDYVDRGRDSVECIMYLFVHKVLAPEHFFMIRGNHEDFRVNKRFGFIAECHRKFGAETGQQVWKAINKTFFAMPLAAVIDEQIFCAHGGIPGPVHKLHQIEASIPCPLKHTMFTLTEQLLWNDPLSSAKYLEEVAFKFGSRHKYNYHECFHVYFEHMPEHYLFNNVRKAPTGRYYTEQAVTRFLELNRLSHVIRAHEYCFDGFKCDFGGRVITVFGSSNYSGPNSAALALVGRDKRIQIVQFSHRRFNTLDTRYFQIGHN